MGNETPKCEQPWLPGFEPKPAQPDLPGFRENPDGTCSDAR